MFAAHLIYMRVTCYYRELTMAHVKDVFDYPALLRRRHVHLLLRSMRGQREGHHDPLIPDAAHGG